MGRLLRIVLLLWECGVVVGAEPPALKCAPKERCTRLVAPFATFCFPRVRHVRVGKQEDGPHDSGRVFTALLSGANARVLHRTGHLIGGGEPSENERRTAVTFLEKHYRNEHADQIIDRRWTTASGLRSRSVSRAFEFARYENVPPAHASLLDKMLDGMCTVPMAASLQ